MWPHTVRIRDSAPAASPFSNAPALDLATCYAPSARAVKEINFQAVSRLIEGNLRSDFLEDDQQQKERYQRQGKEDRPAVAMDIRINHIRADVYAKLPDNEDAETVPQNSERDDAQCEHHSMP